MQSAIGEGMTRRDHADVSNQVGLVLHAFFGIKQWTYDGHSNASDSSIINLNFVF